MANSKANLELALNKVEFVAQSVPMFGCIVKNYKKGYKPAKDFVKKLSAKIESGDFNSNIEVINYLTNLPLEDVIPHTYTRYPKGN